MRKAVLAMVLVLFIFSSSSVFAEQKGEERLIIDISSIKDQEPTEVSYTWGKENGTFIAQMIQLQGRTTFYVTPNSIGDFPLIDDFSFKRYEGAIKFPEYTIHRESYDIILGNHTGIIQYPAGNYTEAGDHHTPAQFGFLPLRWAFEEEYNIEYSPGQIVMTKK